jgi:formate dehydrogenase iron-sulfur subunit
MAIPGLEVIQSSASLRGTGSGLRKVPNVAKLIDTSTCIGCKACEVACQEWNDLPNAKTVQDGNYQTLPTMTADFWNLIKFQEAEVDGNFNWLMRKDQCMHCGDPGCLKACPAPGAIVQYSNGIVDVNPDLCIGCRLCETGCPFDVPRFSEKTGKMSKCTLCVDRTTASLEPACVKACPTGCLHFGSKANMKALGNERVNQLKAEGYAAAALYDPAGVGGTGVLTVLKYGDKPELYGLPKDPTVPKSVRFVKSYLRPLGLIGLGAVVVGLVGHYLRFGPRVTPKDPPSSPPPPMA